MISNPGKGPPRVSLTGRPQPTAGTKGLLIGLFTVGTTDPARVFEVPGRRSTSPGDLGAAGPRGPEATRPADACGQLLLRPAVRHRQRRRVARFRHPRRRGHHLHCRGVHGSGGSGRHLSVRPDPGLGDDGPVRCPAVSGSRRHPAHGHAGWTSSATGCRTSSTAAGPCDGPCKKQPGDATTRFFAPTTLIASNDSISDEFIKLHSNKGGTCFGDSGGPNLLGGTNIVLGLFVANSICSGNTYSYRWTPPRLWPGSRRPSARTEPACSRRPPTQRGWALAAAHRGHSRRAGVRPVRWRPGRPRSSRSCPYPSIARS